MTSKGKQGQRLDSFKDSTLGPPFSCPSCYLAYLHISHLGTLGTVVIDVQDKNLHWDRSLEFAIRRCDPEQVLGHVLTVQDLPRRNSPLIPNLADAELAQRISL